AAKMPRPPLALTASKLSPPSSGATIVGHSPTAPVDTASVDTPSAVNATAVSHSAAIDAATINARVDTAIISRPAWRIRCIPASPPYPTTVHAAFAIPQARPSIDGASITPPSIDAASVTPPATVHAAPSIHSSPPLCDGGDRRRRFADIANVRMRL